MREYALNCVDDIEFVWSGIHGLIVPFSPKRYILCFQSGDRGTEFHDVDEMLKAPCLDGHSIAEICDELDFLR